jgi:hypothetical protein
MNHKSLTPLFNNGLFNKVVNNTDYRQIIRYINNCFESIRKEPIVDEFSVLSRY